MGKLKKNKAPKAGKSPLKAPSKAPTKSGGAKKRTSDKKTTGGTLLDAMAGAFQGGNLPALPSLPSMSGSSNIQYNPMTGGFQQRRKKSRKGLSASDIKGFMRVNKFAGMLTKVSGKKHHVVTRRRK